MEPQEYKGQDDKEEDESVTWTCEVCDTVNPNAIEVCSKCGLDK